MIGFVELLLLCSLARAVDIHVWASAPLNTWTNRSSLDAVCDGEYAGGVALVCVAPRAIYYNFPETYNITTRATGGSAWNTDTPIASATNVRNTLFAGTLATPILTISGTSTGSDIIATSCNTTGFFIPGQGCGSAQFASRGGSSGYGTAVVHWLFSGLSVTCNNTFRVYCIEGPYNTQAPTRAPTPPTKTPTTRVPTTLAPTNAPTRMPTTSSPTTGSPTVTACSTCSVTVFPGPFSNVTNFDQFTLGPAGDEVTILIHPGSVPNCTNNCSVLVTVAPVEQGPYMEKPAGSQIVRFDVFDGAVARNGSVTLSAPVNFLMPYPEELSACNSDIVGECVWWTGTGWSPSGCTSSRKFTGTLCLCTHFTIFAVRLAPGAVDPCMVRLAPSLLYQAFMGIYGFVAFYCLIAICVLLKKGGKAHEETIITHALICLDAGLRLCGCMSYANYWGDEPALGIFVALPYPLEYYIFSRVTAEWPSLVPFAMLNADMRWRKVRKYFLLLNFLGAVLGIGLFAIYMQAGSFLTILTVSYIAVVLVTFVLAGLYIATSLGYWVYSIKILIEMKKGEGGLSILVFKHMLSPHAFIRWLGRTAAVLFVVQGVVGILAVAVVDQFLVWIGISFTANVLALLFTLSTFWRLCSSQGSTPSKGKYVGSQTTELNQLRSREDRVPRDDESTGGRPPPPSVSPQSTAGSRPPPPGSFPSQSASATYGISPVSPAEAASHTTDYSPETMGTHRPCGHCGALLDPRELACTSCGRTPETRTCPKCGLEISSKYLNCVACGSRFGV